MANDPRFEVYPRADENAEFGWRFRDANGRVTFVGGEGFSRREDAYRALAGAVDDALRVGLGQNVKVDVSGIPVLDVYPDRAVPIKVSAEGDRLAVELEEPEG